ncbi:hypothetical protein, partial [Stakelama pacifica]
SSLNLDRFIRPSPCRRPDSTYQWRKSRGSDHWLRIAYHSVMTSRIRSIPISTGHPLRTELNIRQRRNALRARVRATDQDQDWKLFLLSFAAFFICFYTFIA